METKPASDIVSCIPSQARKQGADNRVKTSYQRTLDKITNVIGPDYQQVKPIRHGPKTDLCARNVSLATLEDRKEGRCYEIAYTQPLLAMMSQAKSTGILMHGLKAN